MLKKNCNFTFIIYSSKLNEKEEMKDARKTNFTNCNLNNNFATHNVIFSIAV